MMGTAATGAGASVHLVILLEEIKQGCVIVQIARIRQGY